MRDKIKRLQRELESKYKFDLSVHEGHKELEKLLIEKKIPDSPDVRTIKRIFDDKKKVQLTTQQNDKQKDYKPYLATREAIVKLLGYANWSNFESNLENVYCDGTLFYPEDIDIESLRKGDFVTLGWKTSYYFDVEYLGKNTFKIIASSSPDCHIGRVFNANSFEVRSMIQMNTKLDEFGNIKNPRIGYKMRASIIAVIEGDNFEDLDEFIML